MPKKKPVVEKVEEVAEEEEEVTCPVCGKPVGIAVASCPFCGAEFEEEAVEEVEEEEEAPEVAAAPAEAAEEGVSEDEMAECPVCGTMVSLSVSSCTNCGAEFEEEEIEEVVEVEEVEEEPVRAAPARPRPSVIRPDEEVLVEEEMPAAEFAAIPSGITDLRVVGISLILLGILGSQISFMIDWYWTWVPPIGDNLAIFVAVPAVVIVAGLLVFMMIKRAPAGRRKKLPAMMPRVALSLFLFGILALILVMLWDPINSALQSSSVGVGGVFIAVLIVGLLAVFMGNRTATTKSSY